MITHKNQKLNYLNNKIKLQNKVIIIQKLCNKHNTPNLKYNILDIFSANQIFNRII